MTHILVVDDELSIRETFQAFLEDEGYQVDTAADFFEAKTFLEDNSCDIVVADIILPRVGGLSLLQRVREIDGDVPVIMVTGEPDVNTAIEAMRRGAYNYIAKPVNQEMLTRAVAQAVEKKRLTDEKRRLEVENRAYQAELERRVTERTAELTALIEIGRDISATLDLTEVLRRVARRAIQLCDAYSCIILMMEQDERMLCPVMAQFHDGRAVQRIQLLLEDTCPSVPLDRLVEVQQVVREQEPLFVRDAASSSLPRYLVDTFGAESVLLVPMVSKERVIGVMGLAHVDPRLTFTGEQTDLAMAIAAHAAVAADNARLFESERKRASQLAVVNQVAHRIVSILDLEQILQEIVTAIQQGFGYFHVGLLLQDEEHSDLELLAIVGGFEDVISLDYHQAIGEGLIGWAAETGRSVLVNDVSRDPHYIQGFLEESKVTNSELCVPLKVGDRAIGVLDVQETRLNAFDQTDLMALETLADQIAVAIGNVRLFEEARRRAVQLEVASEVARDAAAILDVDRLLNEVVQLISDKFGFYHAGVFLVDKQGQYAVLHAASSPGGQQILRRGHRLKIGEEGIVGYVARTGEPRIALDVGRDAVHFANPDLPETRSEMALPLVNRGDVIGVLDVQSKQETAFTEEDIATLRTMADQLAIAIGNARLYNAARREIARRARAEEALQERAARLELVARVGQGSTAILHLDELLHQAVEMIREAFGYHLVSIMLVEADKIVLQASTFPPNRSLEGQFALDIDSESITGWVAQHGDPLLVPDVSVDDRYQVESHKTRTRSELAVPIRLKDQVIGVLEAQSVDRDAFSQLDVFTLQTVADQLAVAIDNARLYQGAKRHVDELSALHNIDVAITSILDLDAVLHVIYEQVAQVMSLTSFYIGLSDIEKDEVYLALIVENGERLSPKRYKGLDRAGLVGWVVKTRESVVVGDIEQERESLPVSPIEFGIPTRALMIVPLIVKDRVVGVISAQSNQPHAYDEGHQRLFSGIAGQVAVAVENAQLFEETSRRLAETRLLRQVMQAVASTLDFDQVLSRTVETLHRTMEVDYLTFVLPNEDRTGLVVHPSWVGYANIDAGTIIPMDNSISGLVYRTGEPHIFPDVRETSLYHETDPGIRSEMAVPVQIADEVVAVLDVESCQPDAFSEEDLHLFTAVAAQLGVALQNAQLFEETNRRLNEARLIQEVMLSAASTLDFDLVLERAVKALNRTLGIERLGFLLPDDRRRLLVPHPSLAGFTREKLDIPMEGTLVGQVYQVGQPVLVRDLAAGYAYQHEYAADVRSALAVPVRIGDRVAAVLFAESDQVNAFGEDELRLLTTIAGQLGVTLHNARLFRQLQEVNRLRTELVQNVGHELRTPLGLIKGYVELLIEGSLGPVADGQLAALRVIRERTATLASLIHNLTMLQALPREALVLAPVSIVELLEQVLISHRVAAVEANVVFDQDVPNDLVAALGDHEQLELALGHLVDNAIKFSPGGGTVRLRAWSDDETVCVSVADEGIGISSEHLDRIFERFYQVDGSPSRRFGGMGIGLALVWEIVEAHGGTVQVRSEEGKGSTFTVALPQAEVVGQGE